MDFSGPLRKMLTQQTSPVKYTLDIGDDLLKMNDLIGRKIKLAYNGKIMCHCGELKDKVFRANFCYDCFYSKPEAGEPIFFPEKSTAHLDIEDRDLEWEKKNQLQPHLVYLANSAGLKVGVTRLNNMLTRWSDQGASYGIPFMEVPNRYLAGIGEVELKKHISDKTPWQRMVKGEVPEVDLKAEKEKLQELLPQDLKQYVSQDNEVRALEYPVNKYPEKAKSLNLTKTPEFEGTLSGIKGQYLLFEEGVVFNVRSHEGYITTISV
jgi:hypothetical protein